MTAEFEQCLNCPLYDAHGGPVRMTSPHGFTSNERRSTSATTAPTAR